MLDSSEPVIEAGLADTTGAGLGAGGGVSTGAGVDAGAGSGSGTGSGAGTATEADSDVGAGVASAVPAGDEAAVAGAGVAERSVGPEGALHPASSKRRLASAPHTGISARKEAMAGDYLALTVTATEPSPALLR